MQPKKHAKFDLKGRNKGIRIYFFERVSKIGAQYKDIV